MWDCYSNFNSCIRSDNLEAIELAVSGILEQEGFRRIPSLPQPPLNMERRKNIESYTVPNLWIVGLFPGAAGWTIVKTSQLELLCSRAQGATRSRLSELAMQIGCDAFHLSVYGDHGGIFMEVDACGRTFISGFFDGSEEDSYEFHGEPIKEGEKPLQFFLLEVPEEMQAAMNNVDIDYKEDYRKLEEWTLTGKINEMDQGEVEEYFRGSFQRVDEALGQLLGGPHLYWVLEKNMIYEVYTHQQQLEAEGVRLLYFQPPEHYRQPDTEELKDAISNEAETEYEIPF